LLIICAFLGLVLHANFAWAVAVLFMVAMAVFTGALLFFLREVFVATATLRIHLPTARTAPPTGAATREKGSPPQIPFAPRTVKAHAPRGPNLS
jgi:hypothetical protein